MPSTTWPDWVRDGPQNRTDATLFPPATFQMVDASGFRDYNFNLLTSHQYYRLSPACRAVIAADMAAPAVPAGAPAPAAVEVAAAPLPRAAE